MTDLISRADAIEAVRMSEHRITIADEQGGVGTVKWDMWGVYTAEAVEALKALPSAEAEQGYTEWLEKIIVMLEPEYLCEDTTDEEWCEKNCNYPSIQAECLRHLYEAEQVTGKLKTPCDSLLKDDSSECKEQKSKLESAEAEPKRVLQGYCKGADCKWWNPQVEGCNRCVFVDDEYTHPSAESVHGEIVHCKDCRWYDNRYGDVCHNTRYGDGWANYPPPYVDEDYWCKDGERKGGDTE